MTELSVLNLYPAALLKLLTSSVVSLLTLIFYINKHVFWIKSIFFLPSQCLYLSFLIIGLARLQHDVGKPWERISLLSSQIGHFELITIIYDVNWRIFNKYYRYSSLKSSLLFLVWEVVLCMSIGFFQMFLYLYISSCAFPFLAYWCNRLYFFFSFECWTSLGNLV